MVIRTDVLTELNTYIERLNQNDDSSLRGRTIIQILNTIHPNSWTRKIEDEANSSQTNYHILVAKTRVSPGFYDIKLVDNKTAKIVPFDELSNLKQTLDKELDTFIKFFVYFCKPENNHQDINVSIAEVEKITIKSIENLINNRRAELFENINKMHQINKNH